MMNAVISRKQFLRGKFRGNHDLIRPPWAINENHFTDLCSRCGDCITSCPENILTAEAAGFPLIDFKKGECSFCEACVNACKTGALSKTNDTDRPWTIVAHIEQSCLAKKGVECRICGDNCEIEAISFRYALRAAAQPEINNSSCTGCGACVATCPVNAIDIKN